MGYRYQHLNANVRQVMIQELENDVADDGLPLSTWVKPEKVDMMQRVLKDALNEHDGAWLARHLETLHLLARRDLETGRRVPVNAAMLLAESIFNQYYCRALCQIAIEQGIQVRVIRGKSDSRLGLDAVQILGRAYSPVEIYEGMMNQSALLQAIDLASAKKGLTLDLYPEAKANHR
jgi:hypothetical protein